MNRFRSRPRPRTRWNALGYCLYIGVGNLGVVWSLVQGTTARGTVVALLFAAGWTTLWVALWSNRNKPGWRPEDYWVEVSEGMVRVSTWHAGSKRRRHDYRQLTLQSLASIAIEDDFESANELTLTTQDGERCSVNRSCFADADEVRAFCSTILHHRPDLVVIDRLKKLG